MNKIHRVFGKRRFATAFTIVEMLVVIVIIGILAAITLVSYAGVTNSANDSAVKSDLQKIDDAFKQFALDSKGSFPSTAMDLTSLSLKLSGGSYNIVNKANVYVCENANDSEYAVVAMSKSGKRFMVKSEKGVTDYTGSVVWNATTPNYATTCTSIDPTYTPLTGNLTGLVGSGWLAWTGVVDAGQYITNVLSNPSFESGTLDSTGGYYGPPTTVDSSKAAYGSLSAKFVTNSTAYPQGLIWYSITPSAANLTYTCSVSLTGTAGRTINVAGRLSDTSGNYFTEGQGGKDLVLSSAWQRVSITYVTPAGTGFIGLQARMSGADVASGITVWADGAMCAQTSKSFAYGDGSTAGWSWTGATNASASSGPGL